VFFVKYSSDGVVWNRLWCEDIREDALAFELSNPQIPSVERSPEGRLKCVATPIEASHLGKKRYAVYAWQTKQPAWFLPNSPT
jgi:hypothetical protein